MQYTPSYNYGYNPYINPYQNYQPMQQQQTQQQTQFQPQQIQMPIGLSGKIVDSFDSVTVNDVPMDGNPATFIKRDLSEIQVRMWNANGQIATTSYKPILATETEQTVNLQQNKLDGLYEDFKGLREDILGRLDRLDRTISNKSGRKKEVESDE